MFRSKFQHEKPEFKKSTEKSEWLNDGKNVVDFIITGENPALQKSCRCSATGKCHSCRNRETLYLRPGRKKCLGSGHRAGRFGRKKNVGRKINTTPRKIPSPVFFSPLNHRNSRSSAF